MKILCIFGIGTPIISTNFTLQRGTADGAIGGLQGMVGLKHFEVAKNVMASNGLIVTYIHGYAINLKRFNVLPEAYRTAVIKAAGETRNAAQDNMIAGYEAYLKTAADTGMNVFTPDRGSRTSRLVHLPGMGGVNPPARVGVVWTGHADTASVLRRSSTDSALFRDRRLRPWLAGAGLSGQYRRIS